MVTLCVSGTVTIGIRAGLGVELVGGVFGLYPGGGP